MNKYLLSSNRSFLRTTLIGSISSFSRIFAGGLLSVLIAAAPSVRSGEVPPNFTATFTPDSIGPGSGSVLRFDITNNAVPVTGLSFTATLPAGVTVQDPNGLVVEGIDLSSEGSSVTAVEDGSSITLTGGRLGASQSGFIEVLVTSSTPGMHTLPAVTLSSSHPDAMTSPTDLTVATDRPGFTKSFGAEGPINVGERTTLTFTIDNEGNGSQAYSMTFTDNLPTDLVVADPPNVVNNCVDGFYTGGIVVATPGSSTISLISGGGLDVAAVAAGAVCSISVDVVATGAGRMENVTGELSSEVSSVSRSGGKAGAVLDVNVPTDLLITKSFIDDPVAAGGNVTLEFTLSNRDRNFPATGVAFTDDLNAALTGLTFDSLISNDCGGSVSGVGTTTIGLTGGTVPAGGTCTIRVSLAVPGGATPGTYPSVTSAVTGTIDGSGVTGNTATDILHVANAPIITKEFLEVGTLNPVTVAAAGSDVVMRFSISNPSTTSGATDVAFLDDLTAWLPFPVSVTLPPVPDPPLGAGSSLSLISLGTDRQGLQLTGGSLAAAPGAGASGSFDVIVTLPSRLSSRTYTNTTESVTGTVDGAPVTGNSASDTIDVIGGVQLTKALLTSAVEPGGTATIEFTLRHDEQAPADATNIAFTDDLDAWITGAVNASGTQSDICGVGSSVSGTSTLTFSGGTLAPGEVRTFTVDVTIPGSTTVGTYSNTTSSVTADVAGLSVSGAAGEDDLLVSPLKFTKEFIPDVVLPGETVTLRYTLDNLAGTVAADITFFTDSLAGAISGLAATGSPTMNDCGSSVSGTTFLVATGGSVPAGESCVIEIPVLIPPGASNGTYPSVSGTLAANINGDAVLLPPAIDGLVVDDDRISLTKSFDGPVTPGGTVTLEYTLTNLDATNPVLDIAFTDDLDSVIPGLVSISDPQNGICGSGSSLEGTGLLTFAGGILAPGASCTFNVQVDVPGMAAGGIYPSVSSDLTGMVSGLSAVGEPASADLVVRPVIFTKSFSSFSAPPGTVATLTFTIVNTDGANAISDLAFIDDLDAMIPGATATNLPTEPCGAGSTLTGTSTLTLSGGEVAPGEACSFSVDVVIPGGATGGRYSNTTSNLLANGLLVADPATADLTVGVTLSEWMAQYPNVTMTGFGDDPDYDGNGNGLENFFDTNPGVATQGVNGFAVEPGGSMFTFSHPQNPYPAVDVSGPDYQWSTDLQTYFADGAADGAGTVMTFSPAENTPTAGITTVTVTISGAVIPEEVFVKLSIMQAPL